MRLTTLPSAHCWAHPPNHMADTRGMLARLRKLERSRGAGDEMREWLAQAFDAAMADGRMCPVDGDVVRHCVLKWVGEGSAKGMAGEGSLIWS